MKDRISQNPGRVLIKPENGGAEFYATLTRADNPIQEGDALNKANLLTDATAALLGLGENAVPNDAFAKIIKTAMLGAVTLMSGSIKDVTASGKYLVGSKVTDMPEDGTWWICDVAYMSSGHATLQAINLSNAKKTYIQTMANGTWYGWKQLATDEIYLHWWKRRTEEVGYAVVETPNTTITTYSDWSLGDTATFYYSDSYTITSGGKFILDSPTKITVKYSLPQSWGALTGAAVGKYVATRNTECDYLIYNVSGNVSNSGGVVFTNQTKITSEYRENIGEYEYVSSTNRNAYPDSGTLNGFTYTYLAIPFENAREGAKIATGSYVGTGTYGASKPCSLTFEFEPKALIVYRVGNVPTNEYSVLMIGTSALEKVMTGTTYSTNGYDNVITFSGNTVKWYNTYTAAMQMNYSSYTYGYIAIG